MSRDNPNGKAHILKALSQDVRYDNRVKDKFRDLTIETDVIATAEGSARVKAGDCEVLVGVKMGMGTPYPDSPDEGVLMVSCELLPIAHPTIESGPPSIDAIEISRVIDRGIRESHCIDSKSLCIEKGEKVWMVSVDIVPINHDGNIIDLGAIGAVAALMTAKLPELKDGKPNYKKLSNKGLDVQHQPIPITVCKIGDQLFVDPTKVEEDSIEARITITFLEDGNICSLQKGGDVGFSAEELAAAFDLAQKTSEETRKALK